MRSLKKNELDPTVYVDDNKKIPTIDTIVSMHEVASLFHTEFVPFFIGNCQLFVPDGAQIPAPPGAYQLNFILVSNYINTLLVTILIFVPWKKGPAFYQKFSPYLYFVIMIIVYLVLPILNILS
jgi:hypothetical protein